MRRFSRESSTTPSTIVVSNVIISPNVASTTPPTPPPPSAGQAEGEDSSKVTKEEPRICVCTNFNCKVKVHYIRKSDEPIPSDLYSGSCYAVQVKGSKGSRIVNLNPHEVEVTSKISCVNNVNIKDGTFDVDFILMMDWFDPLILKVPPNGLVLDDEANREKGYFCPKIKFENSDDLSEAGDEADSVPRVHDSLTGLAKRTVRYKGRMNAMFRVASFPFDVHLLPIVVKSRSLKQDLAQKKDYKRAKVKLIHPGKIRDSKYSTDNKGRKKKHLHAFQRNADWLEEVRLDEERSDVLLSGIKSLQPCNSVNTCPIS